MGVWVGGDFNDVLLTRYEVRSPNLSETARSEPPSKPSSEGERVCAPAEQSPPSADCAADVAQEESSLGRQKTVRAPAGFNGAVLRATPSVVAPILASLPNGTVIDRLAETETGDGFTWLRVRTSNGLSGWIVSTTVAADGLS